MKLPVLIALLWMISSSSFCQSTQSFWWLKQDYSVYLTNKKLGLQLGNSVHFLQKNWSFELASTLNHSKGVYYKRNPAENYFSIIPFFGYRIPFSKMTSMIPSIGFGYIRGQTQGTFKSNSVDFIGETNYYGTKTLNSGILSVKCDFILHKQSSFFAYCPSLRFSYTPHQFYLSVGIGICIGNISPEF